MNKGINFATNELKEKIMKEIAEANLPAVNTNSVLRDILVQTQALEEKCIYREQLEYEKERENKNETK